MSEMNEQVERLIEKAKDTYQKLGLYAQGAHISVDNMEAVVKEDDPEYTPDIHKLIQDGEARFAVTIHFNIGDIAWSDKTLNPEKYDMDKQFAAIAPSEEEMTLAKLREMLARRNENES